MMNIILYTNMKKCSCAVAGQIYVLISRVTTPQNFQAVGLPPLDMLEDVAKAWKEQGLNVHACFESAVKVTGEWTYDRSIGGRDPCANILARLKPVKVEERRVPLKLHNLHKILDPQPDTSTVLHGLLRWIDRADKASQRKEAKPPILMEMTHFYFLITNGG